MKTLKHRTLAQTIIARVLRVAFTKQEWEVWRLVNEEKMKFPDIGRQLGVDPEDAHAAYMSIKQYMADQAAATEKSKSDPNYERSRGDAPQVKTLDLSEARDVKRVEYMKLIAIKQTAEGILTSLRHHAKNSDPAAALKALDAELAELVNTSGSNIQKAKSAAEQEQKENAKAASVRRATTKTAARGTLEDLENAVWQWITTSADDLNDIHRLAITVGKNVTTLKDKIRAQAYKNDAAKGVSTVAHVFDSSNTVSTKGAAVKTAVLIGAAERKVLHAFTDQEPMDSKKLSSDGKRLDGHWMGGNDIAHWEGDQIVFNDLGSKAAQNVQHAIRKMVPAKWIVASFDATKAAKLLAAAKALK